MPLARSAIFDAHGFDRSLESTTRPPLELFRGALKAGREGLERLYLQVPAPTLIQAHSWLVDELLTRAWRLHASLLPSRVDLALVAVGGYGRGELHPHSDVDVMLLLGRNGHDAIRPFAEALLRFLWDLGLQVGHSVRSLKDCVSESKNDITVATNLMEARLLVGDRALFENMKAATAPAKIWPSRKFFAAKWDEQKARHRHYDDTAYNLEPNIKEGPGGLRDIQMIAWVTQRHFGTASLHDLVKLGFLEEREYRALIRGRNFLWQVRAGLHYLAGRREDRLVFDFQRALAKVMGYADTRGRLGVEQFMKRYYRTIKDLALLNEILLQHFQEAILARGAGKPRVINRRFHERDGFLEVAHPKVFERSPFAMLEAFLVLQQHPRLKGVRASTIRLLRANLPRINNKFRHDLACRSLFMEILRQPQGLTHALRRMNAYGVLGAYLPAFGRVVGQMQHDLFHVYTVDEHSLMVVRNLRRFTVPEFRHEFPLASELIQNLVKPERLYIAGLFHDIAKGRGGDHSELGETEVEAFCRLHNLSDYDTRFIRWLVRNHLIMSWTAQREDVSDPDVVLRFAQKVGEKERLDNLYLLTVADMRGTSPSVWNAWKGRLLEQLYSETLRTLRRGFATPLDVDAHIAALRAEALKLLEGKPIPRERVEQHWARMDSDYFLRHDAASLAWHAEIVASAPDEALPLVAARYRPEAGGSEFLIFTPDREDLFAVLTAGFDRLNLSIWDARIHTTASGFGLDTFVALTPDGEAISNSKMLAQLARAMRDQILAPKPGRSPHTAHLPRRLRHFPIETKVNFGSSQNGRLTLLEVTAQDRPGLLYQVALALQECRARLVAAKVATFGERAEDIFFIGEPEGGPIVSREKFTCLEAAIHRRLEAAPKSTTVSGSISF